MQLSRRGYVLVVELESVYILSITVLTDSHSIICQLLTPHLHYIVLDPPFCLLRSLLQLYQITTDLQQF